MEFIQWVILYKSLGSARLKIILNSASIRRKELLARIVDDFLVRVSEFDENSVEFKGNVSNYVAEIALGKAKSAILEDLNGNTVSYEKEILRYKAEN